MERCKLKSEEYDIQGKEERYKLVPPRLFEPHTQQSGRMDHQKEPRVGTHREEYLTPEPETVVAIVFRKVE